MSKKINVQDEIAEFANKHKGLFFIVGNPVRDELMVAFNDKISFVRFPICFDKSNNVLVRMLNKLTFAEGMKDFISGLVKGIGAKPKDKDTKIVMNAIGGAVQSMVDFEENKEEETIPPPPEVKKKKK